MISKGVVLSRIRDRRLQNVELAVFNGKLSARPSRKELASENIIKVNTEEIGGVTQLGSICTIGLSDVIDSSTLCFRIDHTVSGCYEAADLSHLAETPIRVVSDEGHAISVGIYFDGIGGFIGAVIGPLTHPKLPIFDEPTAKKPRNRKETKWADSDGWAHSTYLGSGFSLEEKGQITYDSYDSSIRNYALVECDDPHNATPRRVFARYARFFDLSSDGEENSFVINDRRVSVIGMRNRSLITIDQY